MVPLHEHCEEENDNTKKKEDTHGSYLKTNNHFKRDGQSLGKVSQKQNTKRLVMPISATSK